MPPVRFEASSIKNKIKREEISRKLKKEKRQKKLQRRLHQAKREASDPAAKQVGIIHFLQTFVEFAATCSHWCMFFFFLILATFG